MPKRILDTSILIRYYRERQSESPGGDVRQWAADLQRLYGSKFIVSPVAIEFLAGAQNSTQLNFYRDYLASFVVIDRGKIIDDDWIEARNVAERIPWSGKPRQLGDCLVKAIANRLRCEIATFDKELRSNPHRPRR